MAKNIKTNSWCNGVWDLFFYGIVRGLRPNKCVELGTYAGYSAYCIGTALQHNGFGTLDCYDLWEQYPYRKVSKAEAEKNLSGLPVRLNQEDAFIAYSHYKNLSVDLLNIDLSNDGRTYRAMLENWYQRLSPKGIIIMEGGSEERDNVEWMVKFNKHSIIDILKSKFVNNLYDFDVLTPFPSVTIFTKKEI
jgi:predicted O-methyltransferase YrrM